MSTLASRQGEATLAESENNGYFETLQVSPTAEPEVIAAAYRALAKKYHPDRSDAPDAPTRMARINVAFQALRARIGRVTTTDVPAPDYSGDLPRDFSSYSTGAQIDPHASLEDILAAITKRIVAVRQYVIDEVTQDGLSRDLATNLVNTAIREQCAGGGEHQDVRTTPQQIRIDNDSSYDEALRVVTRQAESLRDQLAEDLIRNGLNRGAAVELSDQAFERIRRKAGSSGRTTSRLTPEQVDLASSLDRGVRVVTEKLRTARQMVIDELTRDGVPLRTAEQLLDAATKDAMKNKR